jgi:hypothetical protein
VVLSAGRVATSLNAETQRAGKRNDIEAEYIWRFGKYRKYRNRSCEQGDEPVLSLQALPSRAHLTHPCGRREVRCRASAQKQGVWRRLGEQAPRETSTMRGASTLFLQKWPMKCAACTHASPKAFGQCQEVAIQLASRTWAEIAHGYF